MTLPTEVSPLVTSLSHPYPDSVLCDENQAFTSKDTRDCLFLRSMDVSLSKLWELVIDWEVWRAAVHGVAKSQTRLRDWTELNWTELKAALSTSGWVQEGDRHTASLESQPPRAVPGPGVCLITGSSSYWSQTKLPWSWSRVLQLFNRDIWT